MDYVLLKLDMCEVMGPLRKPKEPLASFQSDILSSADSYLEGTMWPGLCLVRRSLQHAIIQECLSSSDRGVKTGLLARLTHRYSAAASYLSLFTCKLSLFFPIMDLTSGSA